MSHLIKDRRTVSSMNSGRSGKSLTDDENQRLRVVVREKLMPLYGNNQTTAGPAIGLTQSALSRFLKGEGTSIETAKQLSALISIPVGEILGWNLPNRGQGSSPTFGELPEWPEAEAEARRRFGDIIPGFAFDRAARTMGGARPAVIDAGTVASLARFWLASASREERVAAEREEIMAKKAEEDAAKPSEPRPVSVAPVTPKRPKRAG